MDKLEVFGARKLKGRIKISGSKNATLPILAATILSNKKIHLSNIPKVKDIETMIKLLKSIGSKVKYLKNKNSVLIQNNKKIKTFANYNLVKTMRAGILVLGPMLARFGKAKVSTPGGCSIGVRPIDIHLKALAKLGVRYKIVDGYVYSDNLYNIKGATFNNVVYPSVDPAIFEVKYPDINIRGRVMGDL